MIVDKDDMAHLLSCIEYETEYDGRMIRICGSCGSNLDHTNGKHETDCTAERLRKKILEFTK
jgi:hypothetical protein